MCPVAPWIIYGGGRSHIQSILGSSQGALGGLSPSLLHAKDALKGPRGPYRFDLQHPRWSEPFRGNPEQHHHGSPPQKSLHISPFNDPTHTHTHRLHFGVIFSSSLGLGNLLGWQFSAKVQTCGATGPSVLPPSASRVQTMVLGTESNLVVGKAHALTLVFNLLSLDSFLNRGPQN